MTLRTASPLKVTDLKSIEPNDYAKDVVAGLSNSIKTHPSKYLYDEIGSELFSQITRLPEYYLYRAEKEILEKQAHLMFAEDAEQGIDIIELGSGNGEKSVLLLDNMLAHDQKPHYHHIDISETAVKGLTESLTAQFPETPINGICADYHEIISQVGSIGTQPRKAVLFLGSNIGNYDTTEAEHLLTALASGLHSGDYALIGFDLIKDYDRMIAAYNDSKGVTAQFNINALQRMNTELDADFDLDQFFHYEIYNPIERAMQSFVVSSIKQTVTLHSVDHIVEFDKNEAIYMESSRKYSTDDISRIAAENGFELVRNFLDSAGDFVDSLWRRI